MQNQISSGTRVIILITALIIIFIISYIITGSVVPRNPEETLIYQTSLLLIVLGSALLEIYYTKPADSLVNSLTGLITLIPVYHIAPKLFWWLVFSYTSIVLILATMNVWVSSSKNITGLRKKISNITYRPAVYLGNARIIFSVLFIYSVFTFYGVQSSSTAILVVFWGIFIVIWPLKIPEFFQGLFFSKLVINPIGVIIRTEWPNIIRAEIEPTINWSHDSPKIMQQIDKSQNLVIPLYSHFQGDKIIGTGYTVQNQNLNYKGLEDCCVYDFDIKRDYPNILIDEALGGDKESNLIGFIVEDSNISEINFEIWETISCHEGMLVWCNIGKDRVYYQVTDGTNRQETIQTNRQGFQVAKAAQIGTFDEKTGFNKHGWLPHMNTPVFAVTSDFGKDVDTIRENDFNFGVMPGTQLRIFGPLCQNMEYHTAVLGVTGSGKTELCYDIIRNAVKNGIKVICVDLTAKYEGRLSDLKPVDMSISENNLNELENRILNVDFGEYGAGPEKKELKKLDKALRPDIKESIENFLKDDNDESRVGIISLEEISNTKTSIYLTEMYLSIILRCARENQEKGQRIMIVVEEAHTVMPEPATMGLGDYDSRGIIGKIAQIALQGRKYNVGLLVIAQRTANVTKTVLTQCNTIISFTTYDERSISFLSNLYGRVYASLLSNLPYLHVVAYGKGVNSQRPLIIEIPFDEEKEKEK